MTILDDPRVRDLPVRAVLPSVRSALAEAGACVLEAPPGAGKTTLVPLALLDAAWLAGRRIVMLEPRRLAARTAARRMAALLGEPVGETVGYAMRFDRRAGPRTRVLVVTEGVLIRRLQADPALEDTGLVIFDEFHERSLDADLGLAFTLDARSALRPDLRLLVMSATLDGAAAAALLGDAPVVRSAGRLFPVAVDHLILEPGLSFEQRMARAIREALARTGSSVLAFLPGAREIERTRLLLARHLPAPAPLLLPLHGGLSRANQQAAIEPPPAGTRKVVLATNVAETGLTIEGIACVVDGGLERRPRFSPRTGMSRLVTVPISRASAEQRRGRAGRLGPGLCLRLWSREEDRALAPHRPPEIEEADLAPLALELAAWGIADSARLAWPTPPPAGALAQARRLLADLGALDPAGQLTPHGRRLARLPLHPRLAHMLLRGAELGLGSAALALAALLDGPDATRHGAEVDLTPRALALAGCREHAEPETLRIRDQLARLARIRGGEPDAAEIGPALALAFPDRVARRRTGQRGGYLLANGRGAALDPGDPLAAEPWLAVAEIEDSGSEARIRAAAPLTGTMVETLFAGQLAESEETALDPTTGTVAARRTLRFGALVLRQRDDPCHDLARAAEVLLAAVREQALLPLPWTRAARQLQARVALLRRFQPSAFPDLADEALLATLEEWLLPHVLGMRRLGDLAALDLAALLTDRLEPRQRRELDRLAPTHLVVPSGSRVPIDYDHDPPVLAVKVQEMFGAGATPAIVDGRVPLVLHLLSPASRPAAVTGDLALFWREGYAQVRKELRGRYPRHPWPEDPLAAAPTARTKPRRPGGLARVPIRP